MYNRQTEKLQQLSEIGHGTVIAVPSAAVSASRGPFPGGVTLTFFPEGSSLCPPVWLGCCSFPPTSLSGIEVVGDAPENHPFSRLPHRLHCAKATPFI